MKKLKAMSFKNVCEIMHNLYTEHSDSLGYDERLIKGFPRKNLIKYGSDISSVEVTYIPIDGDVKTVDLDTDYMPLGWLFFPALASIGEDILFPFDLDDDDEDDDVSLSPVMIDHSDYGEDDTLSIICCDEYDYGTTMKLEDGTPIYRLLSEVAENEESQCNYDIGTIDGNAVQISTAKTIDNLRESVCTLIDHGYRPLVILRCSEDDERYSVCYWLKR